MSSFDTAIVYVLKDEGGSVNNPADPGATTNYGITKATLSNFRGVQVSDSDVKNLTIEEAKEIYLKVFWEPENLSALVSDTVSLAVFDILVNMGPHAAISNAQLAADVKPDGILGPESVAAINRMSAEEFLLRFVPAVQLSYAERILKNQKLIIFLRGWLIRTHRLLELIG